MNEENTKDLAQGEMLALILTEVRALNTRVGALEERQAAFENRQAAFEARLAAFENRQAAFEERQAAFEERQASLEAKVDERLHDTRPLWKEIHAQTEKLVEQVAELTAQVAEMAATLRLIEKQMEVLNQDVLHVRAGQRMLDERVYLLEQRPS